jgi:formylglycine-generating enzyme
MQRARAPRTQGRVARTSTAGMTRLKGGMFFMGTDDNKGFPQDGEGPARRVKLEPFFISPYATTNAEFAAFVEESGSETEAERFGWSFVFYGFLPPRAERRVKGFASGAPWWRAVEGACWKSPEGPGSDTKDRSNHPVVHVSHNDALAYCEWVGRRLPTEAEWEYGTRRGLKGRRYPWGNTVTPNREHRCNIWQGDFPRHNIAEDGYEGTCPVDAFPPNGLGLYNVSGNVWEWCSDWFSADFHIRGGKAVRENPEGPLTGSVKVIRGGSYLCHKSYCNRYRVAARSSNTPDSSTGNTGFRCAADV